MKKGTKSNLTLKQTNERIDSLEKKLDLILKAVGSQSNNVPTPCVGIKVYELNTETLISHCDNPGAFLDSVKFKSNEFTDEHENVYVQLPTIWLKINGKQLLFSFDEMDDGIKLQPQAISKYKGSLVDGKLRSIPNHAPDFSQFSFNKATKFCNWVDGEQLNWLTVLYIQIMWAYAYQTKNNDKILPNENYDWNTERDTAWSDTGKGIGEFLGIEQLFTSGRNFVSFDGRDESEETWKLYLEWNYDSKFNANGKFGAWGDYNQDEESHSAFSSRWNDGFDDAWGNNDGAVRLCKNPLKGC